MENYNDFGLFLTTAIKRAMQNKKMQKPDGKIIEDTVTILRKGWDTYLSASSLVSREISVFPSALACFMVSPVGLKLGTLGVKNNIFNNLNRNPYFPNIVKDIGLKYKSKFDKHIGEKQYIDALLDEATSDFGKKMNK